MSTYDLLDVTSVPAYIASRPRLAARVDPAAITRVREVGDGNLNLVFVVSAAAGPGLVLKQSLPYVRVDPTWPVTPDRNGFEAGALAAHGALAPEYVPALYDEDPARHVLAIEDLSDHRVWRGALNEGLRFEGTAEDLGRYVAKVAFGTSVFGLDPQIRKGELARAVNPELSGITEDLVFTEPYVEHERNRVLPGNVKDVADFAGDPAVRAAVGRAKLTFMTHAESLIHGDLHTGSVLVRAATPDRPRSTRAFDAEFAFYGPVGFDLGALWGNFLLAAVRAMVLDASTQAAWLLTLPALSWTAFETEFRALWPDRVDPRVFEDDTLESFLTKVRTDAAVFAGAKAARRVIGFAKVSDLESLTPYRRELASRQALHAARILLTDGRTTPLNTLFDRAGDTLTP
ncbi:5'-methylthioribose kinase [Actinocorallia herbida]|uniref:S-methyl-5-thioribose kinase n=1 Tax=Actinocorallia herbida TaxID=58109 RepID=A0A3N1CWW6_9ACTN|nr:S-methyl-5-thioribose kinase [Actinocorallia herbida]ROO85783.1 5'-methylthioribose kinase [Actinocorallia herbida]